jgi:hypothetical protein
MVVSGDRLRTRLGCQELLQHSEHVVFKKECESHDALKVYENSRMDYSIRDRNVTYIKRELKPSNINEPVLSNGYTFFAWALVNLPNIRDYVQTFFDLEVPYDKLIRVDGIYVHPCSIFTHRSHELCQNESRYQFDDLVKDYNKLLTELQKTETEKNSPRTLMTKYIYQKLPAQRGDEHFRKKHLNFGELIARVPDLVPTVTKRSVGALGGRRSFSSAEWLVMQTSGLMTDLY